jgi:hypothetical protein
MDYQQPQQQQRYRLLYRGKDERVKIADIVFTSYQNVKRFIYDQKIKDYLIVKQEEWREFWDALMRERNWDYSMNCDRTPRTMTEIQEIEFEPDEPIQLGLRSGEKKFPATPKFYNPLRPTPTFSNPNRVSHQNLFRPPFLYKKKTIDDAYDETIINTTDGR